MYERAKLFTLARPRLKKTVGYIFVVIGVVALVAPIIPGAPLVFIGFEILGFRLLFIDKLLKRNRPTETE